VTRVPFTNRLLVEQIKRQTNRTRIVYGDWGSTRPREPGGFANRPLDRVDYPTNNSWYIARSKKMVGIFRVAAKGILEDPAWDGNLGIWGEELIKNTAINPVIGIDTPQKNVAARVNIHLHRQAFFGVGELGGINLDEDWED